MIRALVIAVLVVACGKSSKEPAGEPKVPETGGTPSQVGGTPAVMTKPAVEPTKAASRGPEHPVYSLVDNRLSAHLTRNGGLFLPAGSAGFAKYVRFANVMKGASKKAWDLRQSEGEAKVARIPNKSATIFVPLSAAQAQRNSVLLHAFSPSETTISVRVNDGKDINSKLDKGWATAEIKVPAGQLREGENALQLYVKSSGLGVGWIAIGATVAPDDTAAQFYDPSQRALVLPKDGAMSWYVVVPEKGKLAGDVSDGACAVAVTATSDDGATADGKLTGLGSAVDLSALAGKPVRLDLEATGCAKASLANAALVVPGEAPAVKRGDAPKYVVFVIMDALRVDRVHAFNPKTKIETPNFDKLAENSTVFLTNYVQGNESQVSHAAMWSSNYLAKHKAIEMSDHLADKWMTIDEVAKKGGKFTAGASGNGYIRPSRGFGPSWDRFVNHIEKGLGLKGADIMEKGLSFITPKKDQPWFLYLGLIDTHVTWRPKQPWIDRYDGGYKGRFASEFGDDGPTGGFPKDLTEHEKDHVRAIYDSNVSYQDDLMGQLIEKLKAWGIWDQTMLIITADHGDELWEENGRVGHGSSERETLVHVPLLIHYPPMFPATKVTEGTEGIDIVPTLADALGVANDPEWQGASLIPVANGAGGYPLLAFSSQYENFHAGRMGHYKVKLQGTGAPHLYDLAKDPDERTDLYGKPGTLAATRLLLDPMWILRSWNVEWKKSQWGNAAAVTSRFAADLGE